MKPLQINRAAVHTKGRLTILPQLFAGGRWGLQSFKRQGGTCLIMQSIYAIEIQTGISANKLARYLASELPSCYSNGLSLEVIANTVRPLLRGHRLGARRHSTILDAIESMECGGTVVGVFNAYDDLDVAFANHLNGIVHGSYIARAMGAGSHGGLHSVMLSGIDKGENTVIFRDSRSSHNPKWNSFAKYPIAPLIKNKRAMAYVELVVY